MEREESITQFGEYLKRRSPGRRTATDYVSAIRQCAAACQKEWREVTMHDIDGCVDQQRQAGRSAATVKRRVAALQTFFEFLAEESGDLSWTNPVRFKRHAGKQPRRLARDLSDETIERLWAVIDCVRDQAWFVVMWRVGEVATLKLGDVLTAAQHEQAARIRVCGKGQKERSVLLTAAAYAVLAKWLARRPATNETNVFLNDRGQPLKANGIAWLLGQYGLKIGVHLSPHQLRPTFARQVTEAGMPITSLSKLLGHEQISTTHLPGGCRPASAPSLSTSHDTVGIKSGYPSSITPGAKHYCACSIR